MAIFKLGELFDISGGSTPSTLNADEWKDELNWYTPIDIKNNTHTERKISHSFHVPIPARTVIMSSRAPIGYVGMTNDESWHSQGVKGFVNKNKNKIVNEYFYFWLTRNAYQFEFVSVGSTFSEISKSELEKFAIEIPNIGIQRQIIDIIRHDEKLFLKYPNLVRIDTFEHAKKDLQVLIDIIKPTTDMISTIENLRNKILSLISNLGEASISSNLSGKIINYEKQKEEYIKSGNYVSTGSIGDFNNQIEKIEVLETTPTRARLKFEDDTLYLSKLDGERKILYSTNHQDLILSNGMWGIKASSEDKYPLYAFLLSNTFYLEKTLNSTGTTMRGLNDKTFNQIINSYPISNKYNDQLKILFTLLSKTSELLKKFNVLKDKMINLLVV